MVTQNKGGAKKVKVTITLQEPIWEKLRIQAIKEKTSASAIIDRLAAEYIKKAKKEGVD